MSRSSRGFVSVVLFPRPSLVLPLLLLRLLLLLGLSSPCLGQFPKSYGANLTQIVSPIDPTIKVTFKEPKGVCTTAFDTQKQYTGWVSVPGPYPTNLFFWFVAAREPTSLLTIFLNGGPGSSSMFGMFAETGPCEVVEKGMNRLGTATRQWGWDRASNMLFIDQPNQVGFSYDIPTNGTLDIASDTITIPPSAAANNNPLVLNGTFSSQNVNSTASTSELAGMAIYHMMQGFLATFPQYNPPGNTSLGVNLFAESYGGKYGPMFAEVWEAENEKRRNGTGPPAAASTTVDIHLTSLGLINGCVDDLVQGPSYAAMMVNNTYGLKVVPPLQANLIGASFYQFGGCRDLITQCRTAVAAGGDDAATTNTLCARAQGVCQSQLVEPYDDAGRSFYDIAHQTPDSFPPSFYLDYLNTAEVQAAIGATTNFSDSSETVWRAFAATGDMERSAMVPKIAALLRRGVRVGLLYGDRDFICNWMGGEAVSLAIADAAGSPYAAAFPSAGYAPVIVNDSYIGGVVRQFANLSFSRIYAAGHFVPAYQPETAFQVFARIIMGTSVSTGAPINASSYNTTGPANATQSLPLPDSPAATCYVRALAAACRDDQIESLTEGKGVIINGVWYASAADWPGATATSAPASSRASSLTGLFTATATPNAANPRRPGRPEARAALVLPLGAAAAVAAAGLM